MECAVIVSTISTFVVISFTIYWITDLWLKGQTRRQKNLTHQGIKTVSKGEQSADLGFTAKLIYMLKLITPLVWPRNQPRLQFLMGISCVTVILGCAVNVYVPIYAQKIVDSMTGSFENYSRGHGPTYDFRWDLIVTFVMLKILQGIGALSLITCLQQLAWIPIEQNARHDLQVKFFRHLHSMSLTWMMKEKTGTILGALDRGIESIASTMEHLIYSVLPTIIDIALAMTYLSWRFGWMYGTVVAVQIAVYLVFTACMVEKRSRYQTSVNDAENDLSQKVVESLINFETVKVFANENFEAVKYLSSLQRLQARQFLIAVLNGVLQIVQLLVINGGLLVCSLLVVHAVVTNRTLTPGDYVLCTSYLAQLYGPLNYLGGYYRELRVNLIDAESMLEYIRQEPEICNDPNAYELKINEGSIQFQDVTLVGDSGEVILDHVTFTIPPKTTLGVVGVSGSGKTSIVRLLLRLLNPSSGEVLLDDVNINEITLESLRRNIGIVPQDTTLFNDTIANNIRYGKLTATDYEVAVAASSAQLHNRILSFPNGYKTIVGERGTKLSGGERQRVAISRAILKDPKILVLDEATSALDSKTEKDIFDSIRFVCKDRTCLMITHRLSPVVHVDRIIVLHKGRIIETGRHEDLLQLNGAYAAMWKQQNRSTNPVEETSLSSESEFFESNRIL